MQREIYEQSADKIDYLTSVGLSPREALGYMIILNEFDGRADAVDVIKKMRVNIKNKKAVVYKSLKTLSEKGFAERFEDTLIGYRVWPIGSEEFNRATERLKNKKKRRRLKRYSKTKDSYLKNKKTEDPYLNFKYFEKMLEDEPKLAEGEERMMKLNEMAMFLIDRAIQSYESERVRINPIKDITKPLKEAGIDISSRFGNTIMKDFDVFTKASGKSSYVTTKTEWDKYLEDDEITIKDFSELFS